MKKIIVLGYKRLRGKDTVSDFICSITKNTANEFVKEKISGSLKYGIGKMVFGLTDEQIEYKKEEIDDFWGLSSREIHQLAGTEAMAKVFGDDIWARSLLKRIRKEDNNVVISDLRRKKEAELFRKENAIIIRLIRDIEYNAKYDTHETEIDLDDWYDWDYVVDNNGTKEDLFVKIEKILKNERIL